MKKIIIFMSLGVMICGFMAGCSNKAPVENQGSEPVSQASAVGEVDSTMAIHAGSYKGLYTKFVGDDESSKDESEPFSLELKEDGTGIHNRNDLELNITWSMDGDNYTMTENMGNMSIEYTGAFTDTGLEIYNGDPTDNFTCEYVYEKV